MYSIEDIKVIKDYIRILSRPSQRTISFAISLVSSSKSTTWSLSQRIGLVMCSAISGKKQSRAGNWINHGKACIRIAQYFAEETGVPCVMNIWTGDGFKDIPDPHPPFPGKIHPLSIMFWLQPISVSKLPRFKNCIRSMQIKFFLSGHQA